MKNREITKSIIIQSLLTINIYIFTLNVDIPTLTCHKTQLWLYLLKTLQTLVENIVIFLKITGQMETVWCYCMICSTSQKPLGMKSITQRARDQVLTTETSMNQNVIQSQNTFRAGAITDFLKYPQTTWLASYKYIQQQQKQATPKGKRQIFIPKPVQG